MFLQNFKLLVAYGDVEKEIHRLCMLVYVSATTSAERLNMYNTAVDN